MVDRFDIVVIGGGIAGVSAAYHLASRGRSVLMVEREPSLAFHTTGRSAALFFQNYGHSDIRALSRLSRPFLESPPDGFAEHPLLRPRGALTIATLGQEQAFKTLARENHPENVLVLDADEVKALVPIVGPTSGGLHEPDAADIDVSTLHQGFVRGLRAAGGVIYPATPVTAIAAGDLGWRLSLGDRNVFCDVVVNAAGAWGDEIAALAGLEPVGLEPRRRTVFMVGAPEHSEHWPMVTDIDMTFYFKPDGQQLLCSPADETPSPPCDARPGEVDIARAIDRINQVSRLAIRSVRSSWAGLRTFCQDGSMAIGPDPDTSSFVWLVGQGGTGIQTSPAAGRLVADLIVDGQPSSTVVDAGVLHNAFSPARFRM